MSQKPRKSIGEISSELGRYPTDAFEFLHEGLDYAVRKIHGPPNSLIENIVRWLRDNGIDPDDLESAMEEEKLPQQIVAALEQIGGPEGLRDQSNRHVSGEEFCWSLRDLALEKWGVMAPAVLRSWGIRQTLDFGRMVFALVENDLLQKQPEDRLEDFEKVFDFDKAFDGAYKITLSGNTE